MTAWNYSCILPRRLRIDDCGCYGGYEDERCIAQWEKATADELLDGIIVCDGERCASPREGALAELKRRAAP